MTVFQNLWDGVKRIGSQVVDAGKTLWSGVKRIGKPILNGAGRVLGGVKRITDWVDNTPWDNDLINFIPGGRQVYDTGKRGLNIVDELRQGGERILNDENVFDVVGTTGARIGVPGAASLAD